MNGYRGKNENKRKENRDCYLKHKEGIIMVSKLIPWLA